VLPLRVAYILSTYPYLTTTFIDREILAVQQLGIELVLVSMRRPAAIKVRAEISALTQVTKYLLTAPYVKFLAAHLHFSLTRPLAYLTTLVYLLTRRHPGFSAWIRTLFYFLVGVRAAESLREEKVDHIHAHFADRATVIAMVVSRLLDVPYSVFAHAYDIYASPVMLPEKMDGSKFVATCTAYNKAHLERLDGGRFLGKVHLIYHGLDLSRFQPARTEFVHPATRPNDIRRQTTDNQRPLLLSVGQLKEKKGFPYLIQACRLLKDRGYDFVCEIVGEGPQRAQLEALIGELDLADTVVLHGAVPHPEVIDKYTQATLFALACIPAEDGDRDGLPNVLLEAMAMQVPVVSTRFSGIPEAVKDGLTGLLVPPRDAEAIAEALSRLLDDPHLRHRLGQEGRRQVENSFDIQKNTEKLIDLFRS
jgi:glycosyltransferase involved in cell wall biosynthesis